ncbi:MAG: MBL fold metallo-hydrolase [Defluviimonas sp.]|uniref:MBL fold metallo-hydrolase n=1 Tax=Albidovulum sp. TaxID=1872424 RepID=UPI001DEEACEC|nr:MBL fold metallo-hydrolase [Paracoccaceae bacterium]MCC0063047.1 MBL fold metallo-hydrolase [Defluviimonas sp.]
MSRLRFTILGCGSSGGVPRIGNDWGACDPENPKNRRTRCSMLVERLGPEGVTRVLIDTSPDMREQLLRTGISTLDAVLFTHSHSDHVNGLDDLRQLVFISHRRVPVWADGRTQYELMSRFGYAFVQPEGSSYPPICDLHTIKGPVTITGAGGAITLDPFDVDHGDIEALGFRIGGLAYIPDVLSIPEPVWQSHLAGLDWLVVDALRRRPHPTHTHLALTLEWIARATPKRAVLTNMHVDLDHATLQAETPDHVSAAYDGMVLELGD